MTKYIKINLLITMTLLMASCGGAIQSNLLNDAGLLSTGLSLEDAATDDLELDDVEANVDLNQDDLQGASQATDDDDLVGEDASLIGAGSMGPEAMPVTLSKEDAAPPAESCGADTQGDLYVTAAAYTDLEDGAEQVEEVAFFARIFTKAFAEIVYTKTTAEQLVVDEEILAQIESESTEVYQCQMELIEGGEVDSEPQYQYEWVKLDKMEALAFFDEVSDEVKAKLSDLAREQVVVSPKERATKFERVDHNQVKLSGVLQPVYKFKINAITGKKQVFAHKDFLRK